MDRQCGQCAPRPPRPDQAQRRRLCPVGVVLTAVAAAVVVVVAAAAAARPTAALPPPPPPTFFPPRPAVSPPWIFPRPAAPVRLSGASFAEGPLPYPAAGVVLFTDIPNAKVLAYRPETGKTTTWWAGSGGANGLAWAPDGRLAACQHVKRRIVLVSPGDAARTEEVLVDSYRGQRLNSPNDMVWDDDGGFYFTDPPYGLRGQDADPAKKLRFNGVYYLPPRGASQSVTDWRRQLTLIDDRLPRPNGVALLDGALLVGDSQLGGWFAYRRVGLRGSGVRGWGRYLPAKPGWERRHLLTPRASMPQRAAAGGGKKKVPSGVDGLTVVHARGGKGDRVYASGVGGVWVMDGRLRGLGLFPTPGDARQVTNVAVGGEWLYMTTNEALWRVKISG